MKLTVIIAEYNPLHNGHLYQLNVAKKIGNPIVVLLSGDFVQRGEAAILDKYLRAEAIVKNGADLVFELPYPFSAAPADKYALGAFRLMSQINAEITLSFGSEEGNIELINNTAKVLLEEPNEFRSYLKHNLESGLSFPLSRSNALFEYANKNEIRICDITKPNNILAVEYAKTNLATNSNYTLHTIKRIGSYKEDDNQEYLSAEQIRKRFFNGKYIESRFIPSETKFLLDNSTITNNDIIYLYAILQMGTQNIAKIYDVKEGLENKIYNSATTSHSTKEVLEKVVNSRYTESRIKRILTNILLNNTTEKFEKCLSEKLVFNLLSAKKSSRNLLSLINGEVITSQSALSKIELTHTILTSKAHEYFNIIRGNATDHAIFVD